MFQVVETVMKLCPPVADEFLSRGVDRGGWNEPGHMVSRYFACTPTCDSEFQVPLSLAAKALCCLLLHPSPRGRALAVELGSKMARQKLDNATSWVVNTAKQRIHLLRDESAIYFPMPPAWQELFIMPS